MHVALCTPFKLAMRRLSPSTRFILADTRAPTDKIGPNVNLAVRLPPLPPSRPQLGPDLFSISHEPLPAFRSTARS